MPRPGPPSPGLPRPGLSTIGALVRRHDPDRFFTALFAPPARRETLFALYAFNHEIARAPEAARSPIAALIRLQWWREVIEGARRRHEVAGPLGAALDGALDGGRLHAADLEGMIAGREAESEGLATLDEWRDYVLATAGGVAVAAGHALGLGQDWDADLRKLGAAYGVAGILRSAAAWQRRSQLPSDLLASPGWPSLARTLGDQGRAWLAEGSRRRVPRESSAASLVATLARRDLGRAEKPFRPRGAADRLAIVFTAILPRLTNF